MKVANLTWDLSSQLHQLQTEAVRSLGYRASLIRYDAPIPADVDILLVTGPYGSVVPPVQQLKRMPPERRPVLAFWFEESLDMRRPEFIRRGGAIYFSELYRQNGAFNPLRRLGPAFLTSRGSRLGFLGDLLWLHRAKMLDVLALSSTVYAEYLSELGVPSIVVPRGYHPGYGEVRDRERDIAVVWLGKARTGRRAKAIRWVLSQVEARGHEVRQYDGVKNDFIFGEARTELLNRTRFVLNVNFSGPTDELSLRYFVGAANGAVILTEPNSNRYPFIPGKHLVECPIEEMPEKIEYYFRNPDEWESISTRMLNLMRQELRLEDSLRAILQRAELALK